VPIALDPIFLLYANHAMTDFFCSLRNIQSLENVCNQVKAISLSNNEKVAIKAA